MDRAFSPGAGILEQFDLMEGVFTGVYSNDFHNRTDFVADVSPVRCPARPQGRLWILTDRMLTAKKHDYEQLWWLPLKRANSRRLSRKKSSSIPLPKRSRPCTGSDKRFNWDEGREWSSAT